MPFDPNLEQIASKIIGRPIKSNRERSFVKDVAARKPNPQEFQGAMEYQKQQGAFNGGSGGNVNPMEKAIEGLEKSAQDLQQAKQNQFKKEMQTELKQQLLQTPEIKQLLEREAETDKQIGEKDLGVEGSEMATPTQQGALKGQHLQNLMDTSGDIGRAFALRGGGISQMIQDMTEGRQQQMEAAQQDFQTQQGLLQSLIQGQQAQRQEELFPLQKQKLQADILSMMQEAQGDVSPLDQIMGQLGKLEGVEEAEGVQETGELTPTQQLMTNMTFGPTQRRMLEKDLDKKGVSREAGLPTAADIPDIISDFKMATVASDKSKEQIERAENEIANLILSGDVSGARNMVDTFSGIDEQDPMMKNVIRAGRTVVRDSSEALRLMEQDPSFFEGDEPNTGKRAATGRIISSKIPGSTEYEIDQLIESVKANIGIDTLLNIKREGSGLGQVPQKQLETLQSVLGQLNIGRNPSLLKRDLKHVQELYKDIVKQAGGEIYESNSTQGTSGATSGTTSSGLKYKIMP